MMQNGALRVCIVSERLAPPLDEGKRKLVHSLSQALASRCQLLGISIGRGRTQTPGIIDLPTNKLLLSPGLKAILSRCQPHILCYIPTSSLSTMSFLRCAVLRILQPKTKLVVFIVQPPPRHSPLLRWLLRYLRPDLVLAQDSSSLSKLASMGCATRFMPSGVNLRKFLPVTMERKQALRQKYNVPASKFVVLHVGHLRSRRNVSYLAALPESFQGMMVAASSMGQDAGLAPWLRNNEVIVLDRHIADIQEVYQLADCYLFPVQCPSSSIAVPLSVLEAMACNLPVVTYPFGGLPLLFKEGNGLLYGSSKQQLLQRLTEVSQLPSVSTRRMVEPLSWEHVADHFLNVVTSQPTGDEVDDATTIVTQSGRGRA